MKTVVESWVKEKITHNPDHNHYEVYFKFFDYKLFWLIPIYRTEVIINSFYSDGCFLHKKSEFVLIRKFQTIQDAKDEIDKQIHQINKKNQYEIDTKITKVNKIIYP